MPWAGEIAEPRPGLVVAGYRGGWFHPGTGYSFPVAVRLARALALADPDHVREHGLREFWKRHQRQRHYSQFLNRLLFRWYPPDARWHIFARFYRMPAPLVERFYALRLSVSDQARLLFGRPPAGLSLRYRFAPKGER